MLVGVLDDRSIGIIQRYFGLADGREWDIKEISSYYKLSSVTIRKIIKNGLDKMKSIADDIGLDKYELLR
jgi:DNA-directed RNA polymerase sigma subunit (sigma70/sigma32)